jgi:hypothetical protein
MRVEHETPGVSVAPSEAGSLGWVWSVWAESLMRTLVGDELMRA